MAEDDNGTDVSGSRDFEKIFWALRGSLTQLSIGNYIWDDLIIYIGEICKELEVVQINSALVTDGSILHMIIMSKLFKALDVSGCVKFCGISFQQVDQENFNATKLKWLQVNLDVHEMQMLKERVQVLAPTC